MDINGAYINNILKIYRKISKNEQKIHLIIKKVKKRILRNSSLNPQQVNKAEAKTGDHRKCVY